MSKKKHKKTERKHLAAEGRLREAYQHWHSTAKSYDDPEQFRIYLNSCIQALRNVTFVLQKQKREIPHFRTWYSEWQDFLKKDPIMSWCVSARNQIVKQGDLETHSIARASYLANYLVQPEKDFTADPFSLTEDIAKKIAGLLPEKWRESGYLKVERRWVADSLPAYELLEALAYVFSVLAKLVFDARIQDGPPLNLTGTNKKNDIDIGVFPACMSSFSQYRTVWLRLPDLGIEYYSIRNVPLENISKERLVKRYGEAVVPQADNTDKSAFFKLATQFKEQAKAMLLVDGHLVTVAILLGEDKISHIMPLHFEDNDQKYAIMELVAREVERRRATGIILIGETWVAPLDPQQPFRRAVECPEKTEAIRITAAGKSEEEFSFCIPFSKDGEKIMFEEEKYSEIPSNILSPVQKLWGK